MVKLPNIYIFIILIVAVHLMPSDVFAQNLNQDAAYIPGHIHVKFTPETFASIQKSGDDDTWKTTSPTLEALNKTHQITKMEPMLWVNERFLQRHHIAGLDRWFVLHVQNNGNEWSVINAFAKSGLVEVAEPDYQAILFNKQDDDDESVFPNDARINDQWHYRNTGENSGTEGADIELFPAWEITTGLPEVIVQVLDSGVMTTNNDISGMLWVNPQPSYTFDINGWNFKSGNNNINDENGHGTHVSGTIAGKTNNGIGIAGVAGGDGSGNGVRLMIARLFDNAGGAGATATMNAFIYGADNGAVISNNSWGYGSANVFPNAVRDAIDYFIEYAGYDEFGDVTGPVAGGVVIFASGNSNSNELYFPGAYEKVINVAATNNQDLKATYSNFGEHIDITAPGGETSAVESGGVLSTDIPSRGVVSFRQGTSMAAPHVTGVAALMASHFVNITAEELVERLLAAVDDIDTLNPQFAGLMGTGRLNAYKALSTNSPPAIPKKVSPAPDEEDVQINIRFTWNEAALAEQYRVQVATSPDFDSTDIVLDSGSVTGTSYFNNDLNLETEYYWRMQGINTNGQGRWSEPSKFITTDRLPPPTPQLNQNYPNPFNPTTNIEFGIDQTTDVELVVYNSIGQRIGTVFSGSLDAGWHTVPFDATGLASGVYLYRLRAGNSQVTRKMLLIR